MGNLLDRERYKVAIPQLENRIEELEKRAETLEKTAEENNTIKVLTPSVTRLTGANLSSVTLTLINGVAHLHLVLTSSSAFASGGNIFTGTLNEYLPKTSTVGSSYYGAHSIGISVSYEGNILVRNASDSSVTPSLGIGISVVYILNKETT